MQNSLGSIWTPGWALAEKNYVGLLPVNNDKRLSIRLMHEMCAISYKTIKLIFHEHFSMRKVCACWVLLMLSRFAKQKQVDTLN